MKQLLAGLLSVALSATALGQNERCGYLINAENQEPVIHATVFLKDKEQSFKSDEKGQICLPITGSMQQSITIIADDYEVKNTFISLTAADVDQSFVIVLNRYYMQLQPVNINALRASEEAPFAQTNIKKEELMRLNDGRDIPMILENTPGVVTFSDAGAGIGYTGLRIRGSDITRINVTVNGIPINDAESQGVFWVNMPDLLSSTQSMQVQRGVGSSTNGPGAFGASINLETDRVQKDPFAEFILGAGSFNTQRYTGKFGTGLLGKHWSLDGRLSQITSDGYLDRARSDLQSYMFNLNYVGNKSSFKVTAFGGREVTYQAWNGVDAETMASNRTFNSAGALYNDNWEVIGYHDNEVDNYSQHHIQLHFGHAFSNNLRLNISGNYTKGAGYYEQYRQDQEFSRVRLPDVIVGTDTSKSSDMIRRLWLDNDLYVGTYSLAYSTQKWLVTVGGAASTYIGDHFGEIIWSEIGLAEGDVHNFYFNDAQKIDLSQFVKAEYKARESLTLFGDLQYRYVKYTGAGDDRSLRNIEIDDELNFFNPKAGFNYQWNNNSSTYASVAVAHREPTRRDYLENETLPEAERLIDYELGYRFKQKYISIEANAFYMDYYNQLVLSGEVTDVGFFLRENVGRSYRAGFEVTAAINYKKWEARLASSLSQNRNIDFFIEDESGEAINLGNTPTTLSPNQIHSMEITYKPIKNLRLSFVNRYVGEQYLDNTGNEALLLDDFWVSDFRMSFSFKPRFTEEVILSLFVNNIFAVKYSPNGYAWGTTPYFYPQALTNFMLNATIKL